jgi:hypothetical protein
MPMNQVRFQPGLSMREFLSLYGTDELCEAALIASHWSRCRFPFNLSLVIFQLAQLTLSSCHQPFVWLVSGHGVIDLLLGRNLENTGLGRVNQQVQTDGFGLLA